MVRGRRVKTLVADACPTAKNCFPSTKQGIPTAKCKNGMSSSRNDHCITEYFTIECLQDKEMDTQYCGYKRKIPMSINYCPDIKIKQKFGEDKKLTTVKDELCTLNEDHHLNRVFLTSSPHRIELYSDLKEEGLSGRITSDLKFHSNTKIKTKLKFDKKEVGKTATSHKVTEYYPIRRSVRKTKKTILEEKQKQVEFLLRKGIEEGLEVHNFEGKGRGVVTTKSFNQGDFVVEYSGELLDVTEAKQRESLYAQDFNTGCYMYYFKFNNQQYCIDATAETGRLGRLVNHSRNGNLITRTVAVDGLPRLVLIAKEYIRAGDEITYDYGDRSKESLKNHPWLAF